MLTLAQRQSGRRQRAGLHGRAGSPTARARQYIRGSNADWNGIIHSAALAISQELASSRLSAARFIRVGRVTSRKSAYCLHTQCMKHAYRSCANTSPSFLVLFAPFSCCAVCLIAMDVSNDIVDINQSINMNVHHTIRR